MPVRVENGNICFVYPVLCQNTTSYIGGASDKIRTVEMLNPTKSSSRGFVRHRVA